MHRKKEADSALNNIVGIKKAREGIRSAGLQKIQIKSAEPQLGKIERLEKLKLYREPFEVESSNDSRLEKLREYK